MDNFKKTIIKLFLILIMSFNLTSCKKLFMKEYKYDGYASCDNEYYCKNYSSSFHTPNDFIPLVGPAGTMGGSWGDSGGEQVIGDGFNEVPKDLRMHYYSETEDKFYEGTFDLPSAEIEKMLQEETTHPDYQGKTYDDTQSGRTLKYMKYDKIIASVSLGGEVTVWMRGMEGQKLIATYFAKEVLNVDWSSNFYNSREKRKKYNMDEGFSERIKQEIKTKTLPYKLWQTFKEKYKWRYKIEGNHGEKLTEVDIKMINAEEERLSSNNPVLNNDPYAPRAIPYNFQLDWQDASGQKYKSWMILREDIKYYLEEYKSLLIEEKNPQDFLEEEIFKVFSSLDKEKPIDIIFRVNGSNKELKVIVKQEKKEIALTKITVRVFKID